MQKFNHPKSRCQCDQPEWDLEGYHYNYKMQEWHECWAVEALRVLKPGGHLLAFGGTRTHHRLMCAIEDAGFEIRDCVMWIYGSGFPKSLDVSKAIDKAAGAEREVVGRSARHGGGSSDIFTERGTEPITAPATDAAKEWAGFGTALKPAWEPIIVARKPLIGTVAENVLEHGTGALNIDGSRIEADWKNERPESWFKSGKSKGGSTYGGRLKGITDSTVGERLHDAGRWPANLILDQEAAAMLDEQSGQLLGSGNTKPSYGKVGMFGGGEERFWNTHDNVGGGASRFFYTAKACKSDRGSWNDHPTVKPLDLMRYLVNLVSREGQTILDPFAGSGTTIAAAVALGREAIGIDNDPKSIELIEKRMAGVTPSLFAEAT